MIAAFWYLTARTFSNRVMVMLRRLKQPRYAVGVLFVVAYFGFLGWGQMTGFGGKPRSSVLHNDGFRLVAPVILAIFMFSNWIGGAALQALAFSQAEVHMLFPAPVSRRALIILKLARAQFAILFNVVIIMVLWGGRSTVGISTWLNAIGLYTLFATLHLHRVGAALVRASALRHGRAGLKRNWVSIIAVAAVTALLAFLIVRIGSAVRGEAEFGTVPARIAEIMSPMWVSVVLTPFRLIVAPAFATATADWFLAFAGAAAMLALHAVWVLRSHVAFEEAAAEQSEKLRAALESFRKRGIAAPAAKTKSRRFTLPLNPVGHPAIAIVWKNSLNFIRSFQPFTWVLLLVTPAFIGIMVRSSGGKAYIAVAVVAAMLAFMLLLVGGISVRNDLRGDLLNLSSLKTIPLRGSTIVLAEVASSALPLAVIQSALLWIGVFAVQLSNKPLDPSVSSALAITLPLGVFGLNIVVSTIRNAVAVLFPAFVKLGADADVGIEMMGQTMLSMLATLIGFLLLLIAPALLTLIIVGWLHAPPVIAVASTMVLGAATTIGESHLVSLWIGRVLERTEPSASMTAA